MKMHVFAVAILTALSVRAAVAASEGGDTWSAVESVQKSTYSVLQDDSAWFASDDAFAGSEGGDTWSSVRDLRETTVQQARIQDHPDRTDTKYAIQFEGSEGGDTWARFLPQFSQPVVSAAMAAARNSKSDPWQSPLGE